MEAVVLCFFFSVMTWFIVLDMMLILLRELTNTLKDRLINTNRTVTLSTKRSTLAFKLLMIAAFGL